MLCYVLISWMVTLSSYLIWQIISFILPRNEYGCVRIYGWTSLSLTGHAIDLQKMPILAKKEILFSDEAHFDLGGYVNKQNCRIWGTESPYAYIEKSTHSKRVAVWGRFWSRRLIGPFQSMAIVIGPCWTNICSQKLKRMILATFGCNRTALRATQPKLHSIVGAQFLISSELWFDAIGLLFVGCRQARDNWGFKGQYSWSHW